MNPTSFHSFSTDPASVTSRRSKNGTALLMVMLLILIITMLLGSLYTVTGQQTFALRRESRQIKALSIAEAGLGHAFSALAEDLSLASSDPVVSSQDFSGGTYTVRASEPGGTEDGVVMLTSTAVYRGQTVQSIATVLLEQGESEDTGENPVVPIGPFGPVALLAGKDLVFTGGVNVNLGELGAHANRNVEMKGGPDLWAGYLSTNGSLELNGNPLISLGGGSGTLHADGHIELKGRVQVGTIMSSVSISGNWGTTTAATHVAPQVTYPRWFHNPPPATIQAVPNVQPMTLPPLDVEAYKTFAQNNDFYFEGKQNINRSWLTKEIKRRTGVNVHNNETTVVAQGGVMFVDGDVKLNSDMDFEGVLVATGDISVLGAATFANPTDYPALVSVDGNILVGAGSQGLSVDGWIYAMNGNVKCSGGASGMTGIIAAQDIEIQGGYSIGDAGEVKAVSWPGAGDGGDDGDGSGEGSIRLLSWIR